jgi:hypothetical protein
VADLGARRLGKALGRVAKWPRYATDQFHDQNGEPPTLVSPSCVLSGYFQSEKYFVQYAHAIASSIMLPPAGEAFDKLAQPVVGVAFRRGDYNAHGWQLPLSYYDHALARLADEVSPGTLLILGDDPEFAELVMPRLARFAPVVNGLRLSNDPLVNLSMLSRCDHNVLANSSYAWWGAWLAEQRRNGANRVTIAPEPWIATPDDIIPERWIRVTSMPEERR